MLTKEKALVALNILKKTHPKKYLIDKSINILKKFAEYDINSSILAEITHEKDESNQLMLENLSKLLQELDLISDLNNKNRKKISFNSLETLSSLICYHGIFSHLSTLDKINLAKTSHNLQSKLSFFKPNYSNYFLFPDIISFDFKEIKKCIVLSNNYLALACKQEIIVINRESNNSYKVHQILTIECDDNFILETLPNGLLISGPFKENALIIWQILPDNKLEKWQAIPHFEDIEDILDIKPLSNNDFILCAEEGKIFLFRQNNPFYQQIEIFLASESTSRILVFSDNDFINDFEEDKLQIWKIQKNKSYQDLPAIPLFSQKTDIDSKTITTNIYSDTAMTTDDDDFLSDNSFIKETDIDDDDEDQSDSHPKRINLDVDDEQSDNDLNTEDENWEPDNDEINVRNCIRSFKLISKNRFICCVNNQLSILFERQAKDEIKKIFTFEHENAYANSVQALDEHSIAFSNGNKLEIWTSSNIEKTSYEVSYSIEDTAGMIFGLVLNEEGDLIYLRENKLNILKFSSFSQRLIEAVNSQLDEHERERSKKLLGFI